MVIADKITLSLAGLIVLFAGLNTWLYATRPAPGEVQPDASVQRCGEETHRRLDVEDDLAVCESRLSTCSEDLSHTLRLLQPHEEE